MNLIEQTEEKKRKIITELMEYNAPNIQELSELFNITVEIKLGQEEEYLGTSKLGGLPDLPKGWEWPTCKGKFMTFFAQINFAEIPEHPELEDIIPKEGIIYFFVFLDSPGKEFFDSKDQSEVSVLFFNGSEDKLSKQDFPNTLPDRYKIEEQQICYGLEYSFPCDEEDLSYTDKTFNFTEETINALVDLSPDFNKFSAQLLGYPWCINANPIDHWSGVYDDTHSHDLGGSKDPRKGWVNLLSIDFLNFTFFEEISWSKGFWGIRKEDLKRLNFDNVMLQFQNS